MTRAFFNRPERVAALRAELESWIGTPFAHGSRVKGPRGGVDCVQLLGCVMTALGIVEGFTLPPYQLDWGVRNDESLITEFIMGTGRAEMILAADCEPQPGDVAGLRFGRCVQHCGIMLDDQRFVHSVLGRRVQKSRIGDPTWSHRVECFFRPLEVSA